MSSQASLSTYLDRSSAVILNQTNISINKKPQKNESKQWDLIHVHGSKLLQSHLSITNMSTIVFSPSVSATRNLENKTLISKNSDWVIGQKAI